MGSASSVIKPRQLKDFISWFEIPVYDIERSTNFYNTVFHTAMEPQYNADYAMAFFPTRSGVGGALVSGPGCTPNDTGVLIYLNAGSELDEILGRVEFAGGRVIVGRTLISEEAGYFALFIDSEGNRMALHEGAKHKAKGRMKKAVKKPVKKATAKKVAKKAAAKKR